MAFKLQGKLMRSATRGIASVLAPRASAIVGGYNALRKAQSARTAAAGHVPSPSATKSPFTTLGGNTSAGTQAYNTVSKPATIGASRPQSITAPTPAFAQGASQLALKPNGAVNTAETAPPISAASALLAREAANVQAGKTGQAVADSRAYTGAAPAVPTPTDTYTQAATPPPVTPPAAPTVGTSPSAASLLLNQSGGSTLTDAQKRLLGLYAPSTEESALQDELTGFRESARLGISGLEGQGRGIPLALVRGQQAKLGEQAGIREQTLIQRLATAQAKRQADQQMAQAEYGFAQNEQERQDKLTAPMEVGNSIIRFNPSTGQYESVYSAPASSLDPTADIQEYEYAVQNGYTGSFTDYQNEQRGSSGSSGGFTLGNTRYNADGSILVGPGTSTGGSSEETQGMVTLIDSLLAHPGLSGAVGAKGTGSLFGLLNEPMGGTQAASFNAELSRLQSMLSLENIDKLRGTGAITDTEQQILRQASDALNNDMREEDFIAVLNLLKTSLGGATATNPTDTPENRQFLQSQGLTPDEINSYFTNDLSTSQNGSQANVQAAAQTISKVATNYPVGSWGAQCGRFFNRLTGARVGNSYASKMAYVDKSIGTPGNPPRPGDGFVMPYKEYGHIGFIDNKPWIKKSDGSWDIPVLDSNWGLDEKVQRHYINSKKMSGFIRRPVTTQRVSLA